MKILIFDTETGGVCYTIIICNIRDRKIYNGNSSNTSNIVFRIDGDITQFAAVYYAVNYLW